MATTAEKLAQVQADLVKYRAARDAILVGGQAVSVSTRTMTRGDLNDIMKWIDKLEMKEDQLSRGNRLVVQRIVMRDD
jgi:hypothetical protein